MKTVEEFGEAVRKEGIEIPPEVLKEIVQLEQELREGFILGKAYGESIWIWDSPVKRLVRAREKLQEDKAHKACIHGFSEGYIRAVNRKITKYIGAVVGVVLAVLVSTTLSAQVFYPTIPGTSMRNPSQPGFVRDGNVIYPTIPGTDMRNPSQPGFVQQGNTFYPTIPGTNMVNPSQPGYTMDPGVAPSSGVPNFND